MAYALSGIAIICELIGTTLVKQSLGFIKPASYNVYRDRLIDKHFFTADKRGYLEPRLPRFNRYIEIWCDN